MRHDALYNSQSFKKKPRNSSNFPKQDMDDDINLDFIPEGKNLLGK
jgi:hypothetical protein